MTTALLPQLDLFADPVRRRLLLLLEPRELSVGDLADVLQLPQPTVSRHLKALAEQDWVTGRAEGTSRLYRADAQSRPAALGQLWLLVRAEVEDSAEARRDAERLRHVLARRHARDAFFTGTASEWDKVRVELFGGRAELLPLLGLLEPTWTVGDLGCGTGHLALATAPFVRRVIGVDGTPDMLDVARTRLAGVRNVELRLGQLEALPIESAELDLAIISLELAYAADPALVLAETARVLKPGRALLLTDLQPHAQVELRQRYGQRWQGFAETVLRGWLAAAGFTDMRYVALPADQQATGPVRFSVTAWKRTEGHFNGSNT